MPLNRRLYEALRSRFGQVRIVHPGEPFQAHYKKKISVDGTAVRVRMYSVPVAWGETYRVNCPFCGDSKGHLYICHRWDETDEKTGSYNLHLAYCFRRGCLENPDQRLYLEHLVYGFRGNPANSQPVAAPVEEVSSAATLKEVAPPEDLVPLDELLARDPEHPAIRYLKGRGFRPDVLARQYGVAYCERSLRYPAMTRRIAIPLRFSGITYGWQGRLIELSDLPSPRKDTPKYWTTPGSPKGVYGYNLDVAVQYQTIIIVEGPTDAWRAGQQAFALLGKALSYQLLDRLRELLPRYWGPESTIVVLLDPDRDKPIPRGRRHHIDEAVSKLRYGIGVDYRNRILPIYLPEGDPGSTPRVRLREIIKEEAKKRNLEVRFGDAARYRAQRPEVQS